MEKRGEGVRCGVVWCDVGVEGGDSVGSEEGVGKVDLDSWQIHLQQNLLKSQNGDTPKRQQPERRQ